MFTRRGKLTLVSALCVLVLASASAQAAGEFEAGLRAKYIDGYLDAVKEVAGDQTDLPQRANDAADCYMQHVMQAFTPDEVARLDAWATGGKSPGKDLTDRLDRRSTEVTLNKLCQTKKTNEPVNGETRTGPLSAIRGLNRSTLSFETCQLSA